MSSRLRCRAFDFVVLVAVVGNPSGIVSCARLNQVRVSGAHVRVRVQGDGHVAHQRARSPVLSTTSQPPNLPTYAVYYHSRSCADNCLSYSALILIATPFDPLLYCGAPPQSQSFCTVAFGRNAIGTTTTPNIARCHHSHPYTDDIHNPSQAWIWTLTWRRPYRSRSWRTPFAAMPMIFWYALVLALACPLQIRGPRTFY